MAQSQSFIPYSPIGRHGVIGDRRTAALVAADGTLDWFCLPNYDDSPVFSALLDAAQGAFWRVGPGALLLGAQRYIDETALLQTRWQLPHGELELTDCMAWPENERQEDTLHRRVLVRRLRCTRGTAESVFDLGLPDPSRVARIEPSAPNTIELIAGDRRLRLWSSHPVTPAREGIRGHWRLAAGDECWFVLELAGEPIAWHAAVAYSVLEQATEYWREWTRKISRTGPRQGRVRQAAMIVHLLSFAPAGSLVAAPTTSLPERIGGPRNYDYRYAWVRDASLSLAILSLLGDTRSAERYMDWLAGLGSSSDMPLQVVYRIDGDTELPERNSPAFAGYRQSRPVRTGNHASRQLQLDSLGFLADCAHTFLQQGGNWRPQYWDMIRRVADYTVQHWSVRGNSIWELDTQLHYVSSLLMSWVTLDRAVKIAQQTRQAGPVGQWQSTANQIHASVLLHGWSERLGAFRQSFETDRLDASVLLIPLMGFLPVDDPRVVSTVNAIERRLMINGAVYRYVSGETPVHGVLPLGEEEGAFLPCTFWLATVYAMSGRTADADALLQRAEMAAGDLTLFAEELDPRSGEFLGNHPLVFSQIEYVRAALELAKGDGQ